MKNDDTDAQKRILFATILTTVLILAWVQWYGRKTISKSEIENFKKENAVKTEKIAEKKSDEIIDDKADNKVETKNKAQPLSEKRIAIKNDKISGSINLRGLIFDDLTLNDYKVSVDGEEKIKLLKNQNSQDGYFINIGWLSEETETPNENTLWKSDRDSLDFEKPVTLSYKNKDDILYEVVISIDKNYMFNIEQKIKNNGKKNILIKTKNLIAKKDIEDSDTTYSGFIGGINKSIEEVKYKQISKKDFKFTKNVDWGGWTDKYWLVVFANKKINDNFEFNSSVAELTQDGNFYKLIFSSENISIEPSQEYKNTTYVFTGAKVLTLLDEYEKDYELPLFDRAIDFGWYYFLTKPMYLLLKSFNDAMGSFGAAILLLTFLIKILLYPMSYKSFVSMAKIKKIKPEIDAIKKKHGDKKMDAQKETIELYKQKGISPLSGCLPTLLQIPVLFSLYKVFTISIDMRHAPFFGYIKDLSSKDPTTFLNLFGLLPYDTPLFHIGLLPCLMALTTWWQQKIGGTSGNESKEMTMATKFMPVMFLFLFSAMPSGLLIYWTFSNIISIIQQYVTERRIKRIIK
ncbi:MAG: membrane protein insertase YidC [Rickettsiales bacterium]|jgi:YidC/Oxa1 family membrane protein insertase|nr:membrane protein insertase YidC [Rickettsiales bacterium]